MKTELEKMCQGKNQECKKIAIDFNLNLSLVIKEKITEKDKGIIFRLLTKK